MVATKATIMPRPAMKAEFGDAAELGRQEAEEACDKRNGGQRQRIADAANGGDEGLADTVRVRKRSSGSASRTGCRNRRPAR